jgi:hypothetical protein
MIDFADFIFKQGLITWSNRRAGSKLDRFLVSTDLEEYFPEVCQKRLPRVLLDHFLEEFECGTGKRGRIPFWFENLWLQVERFVEQVERWWDSYYVEGNPSYALARKLKALKSDLKKWNAKVFGDIGERRKEFEEELGELDRIVESRELTKEEIIKRDECSQNFERTLFQEEASWR